MPLQSIEPHSKLAVLRRSYLSDRGWPKNQKFQINPLSLFLSKQVTPTNFVMLIIESGYNDTDKQVEEKEVADDEEKDEEETPEPAPFLNCQIINFSRSYTIKEYILPASCSCHHK